MKQHFNQKRLNVFETEVLVMCVCKEIAVTAVDEKSMCVCFFSEFANFELLSIEFVSLEEY